MHFFLPQMPPNLFLMVASETRSRPSRSVSVPSPPWWLPTHAWVPGHLVSRHELREQSHVDLGSPQYRHYAVVISPKRGHACPSSSIERCVGVLVLFQNAYWWIPVKSFKSLWSDTKMALPRRRLKYYKVFVYYRFIVKSSPSLLTTNRPFQWFS